jgi:mono/diheme cytochrome c family protein
LNRTAGRTRARRLVQGISLALGLVAAACGEPEAADDGALEFPDLGEAGKADVFGRFLIAQASDYVPDTTLTQDELQGSMAKRREAAWETTRKVLEPVELFGLTQEARNHPELDFCDEGEASESCTPIPKIPRWQSWYGNEDLKRMFQLLYEGLGPDGRRQRRPFASADIDEAFELNATAIERSSSWPLERIIKTLNQIGSCPQDMTDEVCAEHIQNSIRGSVGSGISRILYSPETARHILNNYTSITACLERLDALAVDAEPAEDVNFTECFDQEFPVGSVLIKAQWTRSKIGHGGSVMDMPVWDSDAEHLADRLAATASADWGEDGHRRLTPVSDDIYTIRLRGSGAEYRLTGMHIITKEIRHWQWVSLWWSDAPDDDFGADRPEAFADLPDQWSNYKLCATSFYHEEDPDPTGASSSAFPQSLTDALAASGAAQGQPTWCSNPYIEHGRGNARTNCIGCHQHGGATVGPDLDGQDPLLDPLDLEKVIDDPVRFPSNGREQMRQLFAADYLYSFNRVDDFSQMMASEVAHFDIVDPQDPVAEIVAIIEGIGDGRVDAAARGQVTFGDDRLGPNGGPCTVCHGEDGLGGIGPNLTERVPLREDSELVRTILDGRIRMPAWADVLTPREVADLTIFLRDTFGTP